MGLSASMWTSVSGLLAHGNKMNVVGNNIANVSTIGFKSQRMDFNDYLYINGGSTSGPVQIGAGVATYAVLGDFSQGSLESTNSVTDVAIYGEGFFKVRKPNTDQMYYTRAGDFYFNADRQLQNPEGYRLQGWKVETATRLTFKSESINLGKDTQKESAFVGTGTPQDIVLDSWYLEPQRTTSVSFTMGLTSNKQDDNSTSAEGRPLTALFDQWDASKNPPMPDSSRATSSAIKVYDEGGNAHTLTVYYDQVATDSDKYRIKGLPAGYTMYEYVVTIPPEEDMRSYGGEGYHADTNTWDKEPTKFYNDPNAGTNKNAGMLMTGHLIFDLSGKLVDQTAYTFGAEPSNDTTSTTFTGPNNEKLGILDAAGHFKSLSSAVTEKPEYTLNFTRSTGAKSEIGTVDWEGKFQVGGVATRDGDLVKIGTTTVGSIDGDGKFVPDPSFDQDRYSQTESGRAVIYTDPAGVAAELGKVDANNVFTKTDPGSNIKGETTTGAAPAPGNQYNGDPASLSSWQSTRFSSNGLPVFCANFTGQPLANSVSETLDVNGRSQAEDFIIELDFGLRNLGGTNGQDWTSGSRVLSDLNIGAAEGTDPRPVLDYNNIARFAESVTGENASTAGNSSYITQDAHANGYPSGVLSGTNIDNAGVVYGYYDNGETVPLYQIALYDFHNKQGLRREGGNLYGQTKESGEARQGVAGDNGFGVTRAYNIEGSNVDLSREFVNMITTQRGFQANSKGITTVDTMLETVIGMKR